jgi:hypothetical protein
VVVEIRKAIESEIETLLSFEKGIVAARDLLTPL